MIVLITGAASGIGRQIALQYAEIGATLVAVDVDAKGLACLQEDAARAGHLIHAEPCDVTDRDALAALCERLRSAFARIDVWINNAGTSRLTDFEAMTAEEFDRLLAINFHALVHGTRLALAAMTEQGHGRIVNMASIAGMIPSPFLTAYSASKFAVVGFTLSLQAELKLRRSPVQMTLVAPGFVDTAMIEKGAVNGFPAWLSFILARPDAVAARIIDGVARGKDRISPTFNGRLMRLLYRLAPGATVMSSKVLRATEPPWALKGGMLPR